MDYKLPQRMEVSNKSTYGKVLNISGSDYMPGAAYLSSIASLKVGCGYCFLVTTELAKNIIASQCPNLVFVPIQGLKEEIKYSDTILVGCGLAINETSVVVFDKLINYAKKETPLIIDADGLNILATIKRDAFMDREFDNIILTPHPKEASRLLDCSIDDILADLEGSAQKISQMYNSTTVLKTHKTIIYSPDGRKYINTTGNNALAKSGSGDVLAGMISGFIAQKKDVFEACALAVYLHGLAGDLAAQDLTQYSVLPQDVINYIPCAIKKYMSNKQ